MLKREIVMVADVAAVFDAYLTRGSVEAPRHARAV